MEGHFTNGGAGRLLDRGYLGGHEWLDLAALDRDEATIIGVDADLRLRYANPAWTAFARDNGGERVVDQWGLGRCILDAISGPERLFYARGFASAVASERPWEHPYRCDRPGLNRWCRMIAYPLKRAAGLLIVHVVERTAAVGRGHGALEYVHPDGMMRQCSHCRRFRHPRSNAWEWLADGAGTSEVSHSVCDICVQQHYGAVRRTGTG